MRRIKTFKARTSSISGLIGLAGPLRHALVACSDSIQRVFGSLPPFTSYEVCISPDKPTDDDDYATLRLIPDSGDFPNPYLLDGVMVDGRLFYSTWEQDKMLIKLSRTWKTDILYAWLYELETK